MKYQIIEKKEKFTLLESNSLVATIREFFSARRIVANLSIVKRKIA